MNLLIVLRVAFRALIKNKVRSLLTMLGIIIGIAAVISVIAVGQGATVMIQEEISSMGDNLVMIFPGSASKRGFRFGAGTRPTLTAQDGEVIIQECPYVKALSPMVWSGGQLVYQDKNWFAHIRGGSSDFLEVRNWELAKGSPFTESDVRTAARVCIIGSTVTGELFKLEEPVGKIIRIQKIPFRIMGVLKKKGTTGWGRDQDDVVIMPWTTVRRVIQNSPFKDVHALVMSLVSFKIIEPAKKDITAILRQRHHLAPGVEDDFTIRSMTELTEAITQTSRLMTILLTIIASISLIVGGIGIMNIMLVSVTERTREIGLRMAVGARGKDILLHFLVEAIVLSAIGGVLGIVLGRVAAHILSRTYGWPVLVSTTAVLLAFAFSATVGIFFGFYPAWRASRLDPIEALRYE